MIETITTKVIDHYKTVVEAVVKTDPQIAAVLNVVQRHFVEHFETLVISAMVQASVGRMDDIKRALQDKFNYDSQMTMALNQLRDGIRPTSIPYPVSPIVR